jgi:hypothetical protein
LKNDKWKGEKENTTLSGNAPYLGDNADELEHKEQM